MKDRRQSKGLDKPPRFCIRERRPKSLPPTLHSSTIVWPLSLGLVQRCLKAGGQECVRRVRSRQKKVELATCRQRSVGSKFFRRRFVRRHFFFCSDRR